MIGNSVSRGIISNSAAPPWLMCLFFSLFVALGALALMNLVTAVVIDVALRKTHEEEDIKRNVFGHQIAAHTAAVRSIHSVLEERSVHVRVRRTKFY